MKIPYIFRRLESGVLSFPLHGKTYRYFPESKNFRDCCGKLVTDRDLLSWLRASAKLFMDRRDFDNLQIMNHRKGAVGLCVIILAMVTLLLVVYSIVLFWKSRFG